MGKLMPCTVQDTSDYPLTVQDTLQLLGIALWHLYLGVCSDHVQLGRDTTS